MATIDDHRLRAVIKTQIDNATGEIGGEISESRRRAMNYYLGEPFGDEVEGQSQVVSSDVQDVIETLMPDLVEIFASGDEVVKFDPVGPEDVKSARQKTDYVNHIWNKDNDGFAITHDWIKDALLQINGTIRIDWDDSVEVDRQFFEGLDDAAVALLESDDEIEIVEQESYPAEMANLALMDPTAPPPMLHDITAERTREKGRVRVMNVAPEELLTARRTVDLEDADFICHKMELSVTDLIAMGIDPEVANRIPTTDEHEYNEERTARFTRDDEWPYDEDYVDETMRTVWVFDCFLRIDWDDDGMAELRHVMCAGPAYEILINEEADAVPFVTMSPIRMPHKLYGRSVAELAEDIQRIKSVLWRQSLDNVYNTNNQRRAISNEVDLDDYVNNRVGGVVRVDTADGDVPGHFHDLGSQSILDQVLPMIEYTDQTRETRTGVTRQGQGIDPDALNSTASGMNQMLGRQQQRVRELYTEVIGQTVDETHIAGLLRHSLPDVEQAMQVVREKAKSENQLARWLYLEKVLAT